MVRRSTITSAGQDILENRAIGLRLMPESIREKSFSGAVYRKLDQDYGLNLFTKESLDRPELPEFTIEMEDEQRTFARWREYRALSIQSGAAGAFTSPTTFRDSWYVAQHAMPMLRLAGMTILDGAGSEYSEPIASWSTGNYATENTTNAGTDPSFTILKHRPFKATSGMIKTPHELVEDGGGDTWVRKFGALLGYPTARAMNVWFTAGTGVAQPLGICPAVVNAGATVAAASSSVVSGDNLRDCFGALGAAYLGPGCAWQMHKSTWQAISELQDANGRYLHHLRDGKLLDYPLYLNSDMPTPSSGSVSVTFGRHDFYSAVLWRDLRLVRTSERFAEADQEGWQAYQRCSGALATFSGANTVVGILH